MTRDLIRGIAAITMTLTALADVLAAEVPTLPAGDDRLLTQPFLQNPTESTVSVVWLTSFPGRHHRVVVERSPQRRDSAEVETAAAATSATTSTSGKGWRWLPAETRQLERLLEDGGSKLELDLEQVVRRPVFRHEAQVDGLRAGKRYRYWVVSVSDSGKRLRAGPYRLQALPADGQPLQILLTSDQQERFNTLASYQKAAERFPGLDAIFFAGDLANHPRRGSEWFDNYRASWHDDPRSASPAFFAALQGTFADQVPETPFRGAPLLQNVPLFPSIANHEVSGRYRPNEQYLLDGAVQTANINSMFGDPHPRWYAEHRYQQDAEHINPTGDPAFREQWIRDNSNDFEVYRDLFTLPDDGPEGEAYYSKKVGDVFLISMNVSRIWRNWNIGPGDRSKFVEPSSEANNPDAWGFGEHLFTPFAEGTAQHQWLKETLQSEAYQSSRYRVVMFHQSAHGLGDNAVPVLTDPHMQLEFIDAGGVLRSKRVLMPQDAAGRAQVFATEVEPLLGSIQSVRYEYPIDADYFRRDIEPLLQRYEVDLVLTGHSHVWNRTRVGALNLMETSNVGNCFGAYWEQDDGTPWQDRRRISGDLALELEQGAEVSRWNPDNYPRVGDPHGRRAILPTLAQPMMMIGEAAEPVPFVCSNNLTTFTILDTGMGAVRSFAFDVRDPDGKVIEFDRFELR